MMQQSASRNRAGLGTWRGFLDVTDVFDQWNAMPATTCGPRLVMQLFAVLDLGSRSFKGIHLGVYFDVDSIEN